MARPRDPPAGQLDAMTDERYHAYRQVMAALATDGAAVLTPTERDLLCDAAEGYLLMRSASEGEAADLAANVAGVLGALVESGRWREETAVAVQSAIEACGPRLEPVPA
ncbi:MAG: hypothetical protein ACRDLQ_08455 [Solirubrobacterales bacterium]